MCHQAKLTELAVAVKLSLILLLPAFAHAECVVCEVGLCREEGGGVKGQAARLRASQGEHRRGIKTQASPSSAWGRRRRRRRWHV